MTASINGDALIAHLFHTMVTLRASQAVQLRVVFHVASHDFRQYASFRGRL
jgi:hypothetical protein